MYIKFKNNEFFTGAYQAFSLFEDLRTIVFYTKKGVLKKVFQFQIQFRRSRSAFAAYCKIREALESGRSSLNLSGISCSMSQTLADGISSLYFTRMTKEALADIDDDDYYEEEEDFDDELDEDLEDDPDENYII